MNKVSSILLLVIFCVLEIPSIDAQVYVDYEKVQTAINTPNGKQNYQILESRLKDLDTSLSESDMYHLYYGSSILSKNINIETASVESLKLLIQKENKTPEDWDTILQSCEADFQNNPMRSLSDFRYLLILYYRMEQLEKFEQLGTIYSKLLAAILSTGNGVEKTQAIDIISVEDEYLIMQIFNLKSTEQEVINEKAHTYDRIKCTAEDGSATEIWFDVSRVFAVYAEQLKK